MIRFELQGHPFGMFNWISESYTHIQDNLEAHADKLCEAWRLIKVNSFVDHRVFYKKNKLWIYII